MEITGFPAWILNESPPVTLRTYEPGYIALVDKWCKLLILMLCESPYIGFRESIIASIKAIIVFEWWSYYSCSVGK